MRIVALLALVAAVAYAPAPAARAREHAQATRLAALETAVVRELNRARAERSLAPLRAAPGLRAAALAHSRSMLGLGFFGHDSADGTSFGERIRRYYTSRGWQSWSVGETLFARTGRRVEAAEVVSAWLGSAPHREIVLSRSFREVGIGALWAPAAPREFGNAEAIAVTADFGVRR